jgi:cytochrome c-type biogenesis protein CcmH
VDKDGKAGPPQEGDLEGEFEKNPTLVGGTDIEIMINKAY